MPELPEVEITARLLDGALQGAVVESVRAPGINTLKTFAPPLAQLSGRTLTRIARRGKLFTIEFDDDLTLLIHLMSSGRLQLFGTPAGPRDRTSRLLIGLEDGRQLRLREFGTKQAAWAKLLVTHDLGDDEVLARLGPEAWPAPPADFAQRVSVARPLHAVLRDQHVIAGIGRSWVDEILWTAQLSPFKRGADLSSEEVAVLSDAIAANLERAIEHYGRTVQLPVPDKLPMPLLVHRHEGEPCPRCTTTLESVNFDAQVIAYCPHCQTGGRVLKDRRLSRLLK
jgi:formamidopyrimidine-DNA glycosylase